MASSGLEEFKRVVADFSDVGAIGLKLAVAAPLLDYVVKFGPPPVRAVSALTSVSELLVLLWSFHFWSGLDRVVQNRLMKRALICFCTGLIGSLALIEMFTIIPGPDRERVVEGFVLQPSTKALAATGISPEEALRDAEFDASAVWVQSSVVLVRVSLVVLWVTTFTALAAYISLFVIMHRAQDTIASPAAPPSAP
jgi:hypothetical protein